MTTNTKYDQEEDYEAFLAVLPDMIEKSAGKIVVFHHKKCVRFFDSLDEAIKFGDSEYGPERYIAQEVIEEGPEGAPVLSYSLAI